MKTRIKLCGMTRPEDIDVVNELQPDLIGFVFVPGRKRTVTLEQARALKSRLDPGIRTVGVFINEDPEVPAGLVREGIIDQIQLHGTEDNDYIENLWKRIGPVPILRAFRIGPDTDLSAIEHCSADMVLLDSGAGTGMTFNWELIRSLQRPYFLAGGLSPENAGQAIRTLHPYGLDVSSGIETDGIKDPDKMAAFVAAVRKEDAL